MSALVSVDWLEKHQSSNDLVILYTRLANISTGDIESIKNKVIPSARLFDFENEFCDRTNSLPHTMPDAEQFTQQAQKLGINKNSTIVIYDSQGLYASPRAWWMFKAMGHEAVFVLNGGLPAWRQKGNEVVSDLAYSVTQGDFIATPKTHLFADRQEVLDNIQTKQKQVLDARSNARFLGNAPEPRQGVRSGHIPNAKNLPFTDLIADGHLRNDKALRHTFNQLVANDSKLLMSCGSGVTACILALAAIELGYEDVAVYDGSWTEWGGDPSLPIETKE